ncbi:MAG: hypothetical protein AB7W59_25020 [Acidimicrobiia bacterium]
MAFTSPHLSDLVYDWDIPGDEVALRRPGADTEYLPKDVAIDIAHAQGKHLVPEFYAGGEPDSCNVATAAVPHAGNEHPTSNARQSWTRSCRSFASENATCSPATPTPSPDACGPPRVISPEVDAVLR